MFEAKINHILWKWKEEANLTEPMLYGLDFDTKIITLYTLQPGRLIGAKGHLYDKYLKEIQDFWPYFKDFYIVEVKGMAGSV